MNRYARAPEQHPSSACHELVRDMLWKCPQPNMWLCHETYYSETRWVMSLQLNSFPLFECPFLPRFPPSPPSSSLPSCLPLSLSIIPSPPPPSPSLPPLLETPSLSLFLPPFFPCQCNCPPGCISIHVTVLLSVSVTSLLRSTVCSCAPADVSFLPCLCYYTLAHLRSHNRKKR